MNGALSSTRSGWPLASTSLSGAGGARGWTSGAALVASDPMQPPSHDGQKPEDTLDLPPLDGEEDEADATDHELDTLEDDGGDPFDDAVGSDDGSDELDLAGVEGGWLDDADEANDLDVGAFDIATASDEGGLLQDDEGEAVSADDDLVSAEDAFVADTGEEGPVLDDDELREEDLPALDADDEGTVDDADLMDRALPDDDELRWADRAWAKLDDATLAASPVDPNDESGPLPVPGDDPAFSARDAAFRRFDEAGEVEAAVVVPGGSMVVALETDDPSRALLVRILPDGLSVIIAEIDAGGDEGQPCRVRALHWDSARGWVIAIGTFGTQAFRPA